MNHTLAWFKTILAFTAKYLRPPTSIPQLQGSAVWELQTPTTEPYAPPASSVVVGTMFVDRNDLKPSPRRYGTLVDLLEPSVKRADTHCG